MTEEEFYRALKDGDMIQARKCLRGMEGSSPKTRVLYLQGVLLERAGDFQEALKRYDMALVMHLSDPTIWLAKARVLGHLGRNDLAKRAIERALKISPGSAVAHVLYGNILLKMKSYDASMVEAESALRADPDSAEALVLHGLLLSLRDQDFRRALGEFDRAIDVDEGCLEAWTNRGIVLKQLGDRDGAIYSLQRALRISRTDPTALQMLASLGFREHSKVISLERETPSTEEGGIEVLTEAQEAEENDDGRPEVEEVAVDEVAVPVEGIGWGDATSEQGRSETIELKCPRCRTHFLVRTGSRFSCPSCKLQGEVD